MLSRLASYLLRGAASGADDEDGALAAGQTPNDVCKENAGVQPVDARLRQVEVEGDDWILIDRNVEGFTGMDESWYVTPPACFTQPGPVHVETSPLEDLLIEHPSMSVYRSAGSKKTGSDKSEKQQRVKRRAPVPEAVKPSSGGSARLPLSARNSNHLQQQQQQQQQAVAVGSKTTAATIARPQLVQQQQQQVDTCRNPASKANSSNSSAVVVSNNNRPSHYHTHSVTHHHTNHHHHHNNNNGSAVAEQAPRRSSLRDLRSARGDENLRIVQFRSAQKMLEKRSSQSAKRNRLERANKVREVASGKARRPRRQDRLRLNNSGANNNRKC